MYSTFLSLRSPPSRPYVFSYFFFVHLYSDLDFPVTEIFVFIITDTPIYTNKQYTYISLLLLLPLLLVINYKSCRVSNTIHEDNVLESLRSMVGYSFHVNNKDKTSIPCLSISLMLNGLQCVTIRHLDHETKVLDTRIDTIRRRIKQTFSHVYVRILVIRKSFKLPMFLLK